MGFGVFVLFAGMFVPFPSHGFAYLYGFTLCLPALILIVWKPGSVQTLWRHRSTKWVVLLLLWSLLSLAWSTDRSVADWLGRYVTICLFLYAWSRVFEGREHRVYGFVLVIGAVATVAALAAFAVHEPQVLDGDRIQGFGRLSNTNDAAAAASVLAICLSVIPCKETWQHVARWIMVAVLIAFVCLTFSRGAWGSLFAAFVVVLFCRRNLLNKKVLWLLPVVILVAVLVMFLFLPQLTARDWSHRPAIMLHNFHTFLLSPWIGIGQGTPVHFYVDSTFIWQAQNMFAQLAIQLGLPGLILFLLIWLPLGWRGWLHRHEPLGCLVLALWVFTTLQGQVELPYLIESPSISWLCAWLPLVISYSLQPKRAVESP
ncbi:MAG TPA: O-antigen ligase family protein [Oleiagrimonas sp.]|nr:O-antigen ligase family protein [Oleiagrimonas sp.]